MNTAADPYERTEVRDGMRITWHHRITAQDGLVLRADVYRPIEDIQCPVILTYGIYAKGLSYQEGYPLQWGKMVEDHLLPGFQSKVDVSRQNSSLDADQNLAHAKSLLQAV